MPAFEVADLSALEILDSRGRPTLAVTVLLADGTAARGERVAKYNRLLEIAAVAPALRYGMPAA